MEKPLISGRSKAASLILIAGILLTMLSTFQSWRHSVSAEVDKFEAVSSFLIGRIESRAQFYLKLLSLTQSFHEATGAVAQSEFRIFVNGIDPLRNYPGMVQLGVMRFQTKGGAQVRYTENFYTEKLKLDLGKVLNQKEVVQAIKTAQLTNQPTLTSEVAFSDKDSALDKKKQGFIALMPLKKKSGGVQTDYIFAMIESERFFMSMWEADVTAHDISLVVLDNASEQEGQALFKWAKKEEHAFWDPQFSLQKSVRIGNQFWTVKATGASSFFESQNFFLPTLIFVFGFLLSWLLYKILVSHYHYSDQVRKNELQLSLILNSVPALMAYIDRHHRLVFSNEAFKQWYGLEGVLDGQLRMEDFISKEEAALFGRALSRALKGESLNFETKVSRDHVSRFLQINFKPDHSETGQVIGVVVMGIDLTDLREAELEIIAARNQAVEASQAKTNFLANMSHEIRTPLGAILGFTDLALSSDDASDRMSCLGKIKRNGKHLANLIDDLLDISKIEAGKLLIELEKFEVLGLISDVKALLAPQAKARQLTLEFGALGGIPKSILSDRMRLKQVLINVIGNAIKFSEKSHIQIHLSTDKTSTGARLVFDVQDFGIGISQEQVHKLFKPFSQADSSTSRKFGGTGLGLALSKKLAHSLGGDLILVNSLPGEGSLFRLTIDPGEIANHEMLFDLNFEESLEAQQNIAQPLPQDPLKDVRVLIVEDSEDNQLLISRYLKKAGADVQFANNGREGVEKAKVGAYDVILMDIQMPEVDGYEATKQLRALGYKKPILALTAHAFKEERTRCLAAGCNDHLVKPINPKTLIQSVASHAEASRQLLSFGSSKSHLT